jgi:hypothetical protein
MSSNTLGLLLTTATLVVAVFIGVSDWLSRQRDRKAQLTVTEHNVRTRFDNHTKVAVYFRNTNPSVARHVAVSLFRNDQLCRPAESTKPSLSRESPDRYQDLNIRHLDGGTGQPIPDDIYRIQIDYDDDSGHQQCNFCTNYTIGLNSEWRTHWVRCTPKSSNLTLAEPPC